MPIVKSMPTVLAPYIKVRGKKRRLMGVFVGGCIERGDRSSFRHQAHAHTSSKDLYRGWICIRAERRLLQEQLLIHELAHILTRQGHTDKWRAKVIELGGSLAANGEQRSYETKPKEPTFGGLSSLLRVM